MNSEEIYLSIINKKNARRGVDKATLLLFITSISSVILNVVLAFALAVFEVPICNALTAFIRAFGVSAASAIAASRYFFASGLVYDFFMIVVTIVAMILPCVIFLSRTKMDFEQVYPTKGKLAKHFVSLFCLCQIFNAFASSFSDSFYTFLMPGTDSSSIGYGAGFGDAEIGFYSYVLNVLCTCILVPVAEEFMFRGVIFNYFKPYGLSFAVIASATLFGVAHSSPVQSVYAFAFGVFSAFLVCVTGNIKTSILFHGINNLVTVSIEYMTVRLDEVTMNIVLCLYYAVLFCFAFVGLYHLVKKGGLMAQYNEIVSCEEDIPDAKPGLGQLLSVAFIVYIAIYAAQIVLLVI